MGGLLHLIIRILCGEKYESPTSSDYIIFWIFGINLSFFSAYFFFEFDIFFPETFLGIILGMCLIILTIVIFNLFILLFHPKKLYPYTGCLCWLLTIFLLTYKIYISL